MGRIKFLKSWIIFYGSTFVVAGFVGALTTGILGFFVTSATGESPYVLNELVNNKVNLYEVIGRLVGLTISFLGYKWTVTRFILTQIEETAD
jgi:hypothetical protein